MNDRDKNPILGMLLAQIGMVIAMALVLAMPASAGHHARFEVAPDNDIVEVAASSGDLDTLAAALQAAVTRPDMVASNGVIHVIDSAILPPAG